MSSTTKLRLGFQDSQKLILKILGKVEVWEGDDHSLNVTNGSKMFYWKIGRQSSLLTMY